MPWSVVGAVGGALVSSALAPSGGGGGGNSGSGYGPVYQPTNQRGIDDSFNASYSAYQNQNNANYGLTQPYANQSFQAQANNPYSGQYQQSSQNAANIYGGSVNPTMNAANQSFGAGNAAMQSAFDPQGQLFAQNQADLGEQLNAYNSNNGIANSPYGASVAANAQGRFLNDWQNQQLARQSQGVNTANAANNAGTQLTGQAATAAQNQGYLPFNAQNAVAGNQNAAIAAYYANQTPYMQGLQANQNNALPYLQLGQAAQGQAYGQNMQNLQYQNQVGQQYGQAFAGPINSAVSGLQNWYTNSQPVYSNGSTNVNNAGLSPYYGGGYVDAGAGGPT